MAEEQRGKLMEGGAPDFSFFGKKVTPCELEWRGIGLRIKKKEILADISGRSPSGRLTALMGPSGAGKSSLLNVLAGRVMSGGKKKVAGEIFVNGSKVSPRAFRTKIAYVTQMDNLYATATARESLDFSARLRLPASYSAEQRAELVDNLLAALGITKVQNTMVGSDLVRGLSGGEKKRVAIGVELVTNPNMLFLDEPTSGLDSYTALNLAKLLSSLARAGCSVLCTIHQPSAEVFAEFDSLLLLAKGRTVFNGAVAGMAASFAAAGHPIPLNTNPADYVMLLVQVEEGEVRIPFVSDGATDLEDGAAEPGTALEDSDDEQKPSKHTRRAGVAVQAWELLKREGRNVVRDKTATMAQLGVTLFLNLLFSVIFYQAANPDAEGYTVQSAFGAVTIVFSSAMFGSAQGPLLTFPLERGIMIREYQTGTYTALPYLVSKLFVEVPQNLVVATVVILVSYWLIGLQGSFIALIMEIFVVMLSTSSLAVALGSLVSDAKQGQQLAPLVLVPQLLFAGFFISINQIPKALQWIQYICTLKYGLNLGLISEFSDCKPELRDQCEQLFVRSDVDKDLAGVYLGILVGIFAVFRTISLVALVTRARNFSD